MAEVGPVSQALEDELVGELRRRGTVVWLDKDASYSPFVDGLLARHRAGDFAVPVVAFRGSFLDVLFALEPHGSGLDNLPLLIHMPGHNEETIRKTPVLELYEPGFRFRKLLDTLVRDTARGRVAPDELERFLAGGGFTLADADSWLAQQVSTEREGLAARLEHVGPAVVLDGLINKNKLFSERVVTDANIEAIKAYLYRHTGIDDAWLVFFGADPKANVATNVASAFIGWLLTVEYVHDLTRKPHLAALQPLAALPSQLVAACRDLVTHLRTKHPDSYATLADDVELRLDEELHAIRPEDLGRVDTFRIEEARVLDAAIAALKAGAWAKARDWAAVRSGDASFWLQRDQARRWTWTLVGEAAELGALLSSRVRPLKNARTLEEGVQLYAEVAYVVDHAHRRFEQKRLALLEPMLPNFGDLQAVVGALRRLYRTWADDVATDFTRLCREDRFLPGTSFQQRALYDQVVHPLLDGSDKVAYFLIDAFRYEMATELVEELSGPGTVVDLKPRLAELPSITSVGMNVLVPVAKEGRLSLSGSFQGFRTGEFTVKKPEDRARAAGMRSVGKPALLLKLTEVCDADQSGLSKRVAQSKLVVVHSREIDDAGEANVGLATFETTLRQLRAAWHRLQSVGIKQFVFTADHGFLLLDETVETKPYGKKTDPHRRYVLAAEPRAESGTVTVSLSSLGYDGLEGHLLFREDTAVFATGDGGATFVHGGNSPQERIIPVLTVTRKRAETTSLSAYLVQAEALGDILGLRRLRLRVAHAPMPQGSLGFVASANVGVGLRVPDRPDINTVVKDVGGGAQLRGSKLQIPVRDEWTEVVFALEGARDERVRVEVFHPEGIERVTPCTLDAWFGVDGTSTARSAGASAAAPSTLDWQAAFTDEGALKVFVHLEKHGSITESEMTHVLGSPRAFRRFSVDFEAHAAKVPFRVRIETGEAGKRYVREGDR